MQTEIPTTPAEKKKLPTWVKVVIVLAAIGMGLSIVMGIGFSILGGFLATKGGQNVTQQGIERGIEKMIEKGIEKQGGGQAKVDITKDGFTVQDQKSGQQFAVRSTQEIPADFPADIPIYSPAEVKGSLVMGPMTTVTLESASPLSDVMAYYRDNLSSKGWSAVFTSTPTPESYSGMFKKENRQVIVNLSSESGKTSIALSHGMPSN